MSPVTAGKQQAFILFLVLAIWCDWHCSVRCFESVRPSRCCGCWRWLFIDAYCFVILICFVINLLLFFSDAYLFVVTDLGLFFCFVFYAATPPAVLWFIWFLMHTCFAILLPCVAYLFQWCSLYVFFYLVSFFITMTDYVFLLMPFCLCLCLFAVTDFVSSFFLYSANSSGKKKVTCNLWFQVSGRQCLPLTLLYLMFFQTSAWVDSSP